MLNKNEWIKRAIELQDHDGIKQMIMELSAISGINLVGECASALEIANSYVEKSQEIPPGLVKAIQILYNQPSGMTGLSVWEVYRHQLRYS